MKIEVNIEKKHAFMILGAFLVFASVVLVVAYNDPPGAGVPSEFGHSVDEVDWSQTIDSDVEINGKLTSDDVDVSGNVEIDGDLCVGGECKDSLARCRNLGEFTNGDELVIPIECGVEEMCTVIVRDHLDITAAQTIRGIVPYFTDSTKTWTAGLGFGGSQFREGDLDDGDDDPIIDKLYEDDTNDGWKIVCTVIGSQKCLDLWVCGDYSSVL